jgi:flagellar assembly factor FliW
MNCHKIETVRKGIRITCRQRPRGIPIRHGTLVRFRHGVPAFEHITRWRFASEVAVRPFFYMNAADDSVHFVCVETFRIYPGYVLQLSRESADGLEITPSANIALLSTVTVRRDPMDTTANLMSPLVINLDSLQGEQVVSEDSPYPLRHHVWNCLDTAVETEEAERQLAAV